MKIIKVTGYSSRRIYRINADQIVFYVEGADEHRGTRNIFWGNGQGGNNEIYVTETIEELDKLIESK